MENFLTPRKCLWKGCKTVSPFFISEKTVELPVTVVQDHTLFEILGKKDIGLWKEKVAYIESLIGLVNIIVHPDYIFEDNRVKYYEQYLDHLKLKENVCLALLREVASWCRRRDKSEIRLTSNGIPYIDGPAAKDGVIAQAGLVNNEIEYEKLQIS